jgi:hypothetical protein
VKYVYNMYTSTYIGQMIHPNQRVYWRGAHENTTTCQRAGLQLINTNNTKKCGQQCFLYIMCTLTRALAKWSMQNTKAKSNCGAHENLASSVLCMCTQTWVLAKWSMQNNKGYSDCGAHENLASSAVCICSLTCVLAKWPMQNNQGDSDCGAHRNLASRVAFLWTQTLRTGQIIHAEQ